MKHIFKRIRNHDTNRTNGIPSPSPSPTSSPSSSSPLPPPTTVPDHRATLTYSPPTSSFDNSATTYADQSDFYNSEEEFQIQLALAISASNSEFRDKEQIRSTTLLSLERDDIESRRRRESDDRAELLSRRYWDYSVLDYDEKVVDGFYDLYGLSMDPASQGKMPSLSDLQTTSGDSNFEVVVVNRAIDPALEELHQVAHCIALDCPTTDTNLLVQRLADLVTEHLGGPVMDANIMLAKWMEKTMNSQTSVHKSILPIGSLTIGLSRHRALLYKVLADDVGIPCRLVKGSHYTGNDDDAINIIKLDNEREFLVDLMAAPGTLIPADVLNIKENSIISSNPRLGKTPSLITENNLGVDLSRMYVVGYGKTLFENDKHLNEGILSSEGTELVHSLLSANNGEFPVSTSGSSDGNSVYVIPSNQSQPSSSLVAGSSSQNKDSHIVDAAQKHLNEVPYSSGTIKESENLFADLNPLQGVGSGKTPIQSKPTNNGINSSQKKRENLLPAPGRPPLPLVWKNRSTGNELPRPRQNEFMERLLPRKNLEVNPYNASSMVSSRSNYSGNPFLEVHNVDNDTSRVSYPGMTVNGNGNLSGGGDSVLSLNTNQCTMLDEDGNQTVKAHLVIQSLGENRQDEYCRNGEVLLKGMVNNAKKHGKGISDKHNHRNGSDDRSMGTKSVSRHLDDSGSQVHAGPGRVYPMLEDVAEWEIPWEDLVIDERIGLGSYGEVFHADWKGTEVAVKKFLDQDFSGDTLDEFRSEVRIMRRLRHPNVVLFLGAVTRPPNLSIISEFLPRGSLSRILHRPHNQIDERHRIKMALDIAKGMNCLHTSIPTVVHRDLKSPNLLVDDNWNVKVSDFGLSRLKHSTFLSSKSTAGTPEWMAPEVLRNEQSNEKCDVYSFGVILWELATLRRPWIGLNPMQVVGVVGFQNRRLEIPAEVDPSVAKIMLECWQTDPSLRPSFAQLTSTLKTLQRLVIPSYQGQQSSHLQQEISEDVTP